MAISRIYRFTTTEEVEGFVNGGIFMRPPAPILRGIVGKSLVFAQPSAATVTFVEDGQGSDLSAAKAYQQIRAAMPALFLKFTAMGTLLLENDPTQGVEITTDSDDEALLAFGLSKTGSKGTVYTPAIVSAEAPCFIAVAGGQGMYDILTYVDGPFNP